MRRAQTVARTVSEVEPERRVHEHWRAALTLHRSLDSADSSYEVITAFHVLEHLPDPRASLSALGARLAEHGRLVVEVPNADDAPLTLFDNEAFRRFTCWCQHLFLLQRRYTAPPRAAGWIAARLAAVIPALPAVESPVLDESWPTGRAPAMVVPRQRRIE